MAFVPIDDRDGWIWFDGEFVPWREARVHVLTHALHYASSVFEGERMYNGQIFKLTEHTNRLFRSAEVLDFKIPFTVAQINDACKETCVRNGLTEAYVRPLAWRGSEQVSVPAQNTTVHVAIAVWDWPSYFDAETKAKGIRLCWAPYKRPSPETAPTEAKAAGLYMIGTINRHYADARGYADAMLLDWRGYVAEATGANVFFVQDGRVITPPADGAILNGITRQTVLEMLAARGIEVEVRHILPEELAGFSECFLCGTAAEITPVSEIGDYRFIPADLSLGLMDEYSRLVRGEI